MKINEIILKNKKWGNGQTSRTDFNETWLYESPINIGKFPTWPGIKNIIDEFIPYANGIIDLTNGLKKLFSWSMYFIGLKLIMFLPSEFLYHYDHRRLLVNYWEKILFLQEKHLTRVICI
jgi:hypothetical protein